MLMNQKGDVMFVPSHWLSVVVAAALYMAFGMLWYSEYMFGKVWAKACHINLKEAQKDMPKALVGCAVIALLISCGLACFLEKTHAVTMQQHMMTGFAIALFFIVPVKFSEVLWCKKPCTAFYIDAGFFLIFLPAAAVVMHCLN